MNSGCLAPKFCVFFPSRAQEEQECWNKLHGNPNTLVISMNLTLKIVKHVCIYWGETEEGEEWGMKIFFFCRDSICSQHAVPYRQLEPKYATLLL